MTKRIFRDMHPKRFRRAIGRQIRRGHYHRALTELWEAIQTLQAIREGKA